MKTIIAVPDFTRKVNLKKIIPLILKDLKKQGIANSNIEIIIATGLHRSPTKKEIKDKLGNIPSGIKLSTHNYKSVMLAGIFAGLSAWTKNEGLLFLLCVIITRLVIIIFRKGFGFYLKEVVWFMIGLLPVLLIIAYFKTQYAPPMT